MEDGEGNKGDLKYYQNQPYDMEVDLNNEEEEGENSNTKKKQPKNENNEDDQQEEQNYQEVAPPIQVKELPKFDLSKFENIPPSAEAKELLSIMKK